MSRAVSFVVGVLLLLPSSTALALHRKTPASMQITQGAAGTLGNPRWGGYRFLVFDTNADLLNTSSQGRQVFLFDLRERALRGKLALHQITTGLGDSQRASTSRRGGIVVYDALVNGTRQVFMVDRRHGTTVTLTRGAADSKNAFISENERFAVFESDTDLAQTGITGTQIYRIDLRAADPSCPYPCPANGNFGLTQITSAPGGNHHPTTNRGGEAIAYESDADPLHTGDPTSQVYVVFPELGQLARLSHGPGASRNPSVCRNGRRIAFESDADLLQNGSTGTQIFLYRDIGSAPDQITSAPGKVSTKPSLSSNGRNLTFVSNADLLGNGNTGPEVFQLGVANDALQQITDSSGTTRDATYSDGVFSAFIGNGDLLGTGAPGEELYFVNLFQLGSNQIP